jgi:hypothetical protein
MNRLFTSPIACSAIFWAAAILSSAILGGSAFLSIILLPSLAIAHLINLEKVRVDFKQQDTATSCCKH